MTSGGISHKIESIACSRGEIDLGGKLSFSISRSALAKYEDEVLSVKSDCGTCKASILFNTGMSPTIPEIVVYRRLVLAIYPKSESWRKDMDTPYGGLPEDSFINVYAGGDVYTALVEHDAKSERSIFRMITGRSTLAKTLKYCELQVEGPIEIHMTYDIINGVGIFEPEFRDEKLEHDGWTQDGINIPDWCLKQENQTKVALYNTNGEFLKYDSDATTSPADKPAEVSTAEVTAAEEPSITNTVWVIVSERNLLKNDNDQISVYIKGGSFFRDMQKRDLKDRVTANVSLPKRNFCEQDFPDLATGARLTAQSVLKDEFNLNYLPEKIKYAVSSNGPAKMMIDDTIAHVMIVDFNDSVEGGNDRIQALTDSKKKGCMLSVSSLVDWHRYKPKGALKASKTFKNILHDFCFYGDGDGPYVTELSPVANGSNQTVKNQDDDNVSITSASSTAHGSTKSSLKLRKDQSKAMKEVQQKWIEKSKYLSLVDFSYLCNIDDPADVPNMQKLDVEQKMINNGSVGGVFVIKFEQDTFTFTVTGDYNGEVTYELVSASHPFKTPKGLGMRVDQKPEVGHITRIKSIIFKYKVEMLHNAGDEAASEKWKVKAIGELLVDFTVTRSRACMDFLHDKGVITEDERMELYNLDVPKVSYNAMEEKLAI